MLAVVAIVTLSQITEEVFIAASEQRVGKAVTYSGTASIDGLDGAQLDEMLDAANVLPGASLSITIIPVSTTGVAVAGVEDPPTTTSLAPLILSAGEARGTRRLPMLAGEWMSAQDSFPVGVVVNQAGAQRWGGVGTPLLLQLAATSSPVRATVVGVTADGEGDSHLYVSLRSVLSLRADFTESARVRFDLHHPGLTKELAMFVLNRVLGVAGVSVTDEEVSRTDQIEPIVEQLRVQQMGFLVAAGLSLLVSALGILNIGLASITERTRELVVRRALGATRSSIAAQVLLSALAIGILVATLACIITAGVVSWVAPSYIPAHTAINPPQIPWEALAFGIAASAVTTLLGALIPAIVASRLNMADALRE